jgi:hypothetical protein
VSAHISVDHRVVLGSRQTRTIRLSSLDSFLETL